MKSRPNLPIRLFFCLFLSQDFTDFFNICGQHCFYSLNYSVARPGAGEAILVDLHYFTLYFRVHRFMLNKT